MKMMWRKTGTNQRRGEWNALLLVMFALLAVAPSSMLAAAPLQNAAQPQAVWTWLQSPQGAPTRDLLARAFDLENFPNLPPDEWATILCELGTRNSECGIGSGQSGIENPLPDSASHDIPLLADEPTPKFERPLSFSIPQSALRISHHEAAFRSGVRTNSWPE